MVPWAAGGVGPLPEDEYLQAVADWPGILLELRLDARDKGWKEQESCIEEAVEVLKQILDDDVLFRCCPKFMHFFQNSRKQAAEELFCNYWVFLGRSLQGGDQTAVLDLDVRKVAMTVTSVKNNLGILLHF